VNDRVLSDTQRTLKVGDRVEALAPPPKKPEQIPIADRHQIHIVYEDNAIVVVDKPAGLLTVPTPHREKHTLISMLARKLGDGKSAVGPTAEIFCVHRLDRDVSGLLVFARTLELAKTVRNQFANRKPDRTYQAIVAGNIPSESGTFRSFLATDDDLNRHSVKSPEGGELAITHYEVAERLADTNLVSIKLETGRRNQIRVHFSEAGHPIIGETRYRRQEAAHADWTLRRLALHAIALGFDHPVTGEPMSFDSPLPREMTQFIKRHQHHAPPNRRTGSDRKRGKPRRR
jgi:23S rRNA pseudouridine1911/1915/1917 synthase